MANKLALVHDLMHAMEEYNRAHQEYVAATNVGSDTARGLAMHAHAERQTATEQIVLILDSYVYECKDNTQVL